MKVALLDPELPSVTVASVIEIVGGVSSFVIVPCADLRGDGPR